MPWYSYVFFTLAAFAFIFGFFFNAQRGNGTRMAYSFVMVLVWTGLGCWTGGLL